MTHRQWSLGLVIVTLGLVVGMATALSVALLGPTKFTSSAELYFTSDTGLGADPDRFINNQIERLKSDEVLSTLGELGMSKSEILRALDVAQIPVSDVVLVKFTAPTSEGAQKGTTAVVEAAKAILSNEKYHVAVIDNPSRPDAPSGISGVQAALLGGLAGALAGAVVWAFGRYVRRHSATDRHATGASGQA